MKLILFNCDGKTRRGIDDQRSSIATDKNAVEWLAKRNVSQKDSLTIHYSCIHVMAIEIAKKVTYIMHSHQCSRSAPGEGY